MSSLCFLGTGLLGAGLADGALRRGDTVTVWNRTAAKAQALAAVGARVADTPADAVRGQRFVHLVLQDDASVEGVVEALRPGLAPDALILDHTTTRPDLTAARAERLAAAGVRYLHCPVFIGPAAARNGEGSILVAGPRAWYDEAAAHLARMAQRVEFTGEAPGTAAGLKLIGNAYLLGITGLVADIFAVAKGAGLAPEQALSVLAMFNAANVAANRGRKIAAGDFAASFELPMARKDVRLMIETAGDAPLAMLPGFAARMDTLLAAGYGHCDFSVVARHEVREGGAAS